MISGGRISDPPILGREETDLSKQMPPQRSSLPHEGLTVRGGDDGTFLYAAQGKLFFSLSACVGCCIPFSPESVIIIWQRKRAWRIFINLLTKDVILSYTFFQTK